MAEARLPITEESQAILIGSATYESSGLHDLPAVSNNLIDFYSALTDSTLCGFKTENVHLVPRPRLPDVGITVENAARRATDVLLVYYAGHGIPMDGGELYLALHTTMPEYAAYTALRFNLVRNAIANSPARNRVLILDCCFSGRAIEAMADPSSLVAGQTEISGSYTITSVGRNAAAVARPGERHTSFTGALLRLLRNGLEKGPELLSLGEIYRFVRHQQQIHGLPEPQQRGTGLADRLALARNVANSSALFTPAHNELSPMGGSADRQTQLGDQIEAMKTFEREMRTRLHLFLENQLKSAEEIHFAGGHSVESGAAWQEAFVREYRIKLQNYLNVLLRDLTSFRVPQEQHDRDKQLGRVAGEFSEFVNEYERRLRMFVHKANNDCFAFNLGAAPRNHLELNDRQEGIKAHLIDQLRLLDPQRP